MVYSRKHPVGGNMLKSSSVINVWKCDSCAVESTAEASPFFNLSLSFPSQPGVSACSLDLCKDCVKTVTTAAAADYISGILNFPVS